MRVVLDDSNCIVIESGSFRMTVTNVDQLCRDLQDAKSAQHEREQRESVVLPSEAREALERCAFTCEDGKVIVHCYSAGFGADWYLNDALALIDEVDRTMDHGALRWVNHLLGGGKLCLAVDDGKRTRVFDTVHPA